MKRSLSILAAGAIGATALLAAPAANAAIPAPVQGWNASMSSCPNGGTIVPIVVGNYSDNAQTGSYTVNGNESATMGIFTSLAAAQGSQMCNSATQFQNPTSVNFTVQPDAAAVFYAVFFSNKSAGSYGFGGMQGGTRGAGWFDMNPSFANNGLSGMTVAYSGTGGTNGSNQNNFNIVSCNVGANTVGLTANILTPYSGGQAGVSIGNGPICAAWLPQGTMVNFASTPVSGVTAQAGQVNESSSASSFGNMSSGTTYANTMSFAGVGATAGMQMAYTYTGTGTSSDGTSVTLGSAPSTYGAFLTQNAQGQWAAVNLPIVGTSGTVSIAVNGQTVASYTYTGVMQ
jgi:hypothetical protein